MGRNRKVGIPYETQNVSGEFKIVAAYDAYYVDTTTKEAVATLDPSAVDSDQVCIVDAGGCSSKHPITILVGKDDHRIAGQKSIVIEDDGGGVLLTYGAAKKRWSVFRSAGVARPHLTTTGALPTIKRGEANKGKRAFVGVTAESNDNAGSLAITCDGAEPGVQAEFTFARAFETTPRSVVLFAGNAAAAAVYGSAYASALSREGFHISFTPVSDMSAAVFYYQVMG